jgi:hypothetical protein
VSPVARRLLVAQGYSDEVLCSCSNISSLARWTPLACGSLGLLGVLLRSPEYMLALGLCTVVGALGRRSFYDYLYLGLVQRIWNLGEMPEHGNQRRFGCGIGAGLYVLSGLGFLVDSMLLAYIPSILIIVLAYVAGWTHWCFASTLYNVLFLGSTGQGVGEQPPNRRYLELTKRPRLATRARRARSSAGTGRFAAHPRCWADPRHSRRST